MTTCAAPRPIPCVLTNETLCVRGPAYCSWLLKQRAKYQRMLLETGELLRPAAIGRDASVPPFDVLALSPPFRFPDYFGSGDARDKLQYAMGLLSLIHI